MTRYSTPDLSFDAPSGWNDRSVTVFSAPASGASGSAPNIVLTRDALLEAEGLDGYSDRQLVELAKRLDRFTLRHRRATRVGGVAAIELAFEWHSPTGAVTQRLVTLVSPGGALLNLTATAPATDEAEAMAAFEAMLASARFV